MPARVGHGERSRHHERTPVRVKHVVGRQESVFIVTRKFPHEYGTHQRDEIGYCNNDTPCIPEPARAERRNIADDELPRCGYHTGGDTQQCGNRFRIAQSRNDDRGKRDQKKKKKKKKKGLSNQNISSTFGGESSYHWECSVQAKTQKVATSWDRGNIRALGTVLFFCPRRPCCCS